MAKVTFSKLGLSKECLDKHQTFIWNDQEIEVKQYLPIEEKLELMTRVINNSLDASGKYYNIAQINTFLDREIIYAYSNITFTAKQKEEFIKNYDLMKSNGFINEFMTHMDIVELTDLHQWTTECLENIYAYNHSLMGMLENSQQNFDNLNLDATEIRDKIADPENLELLKQIAPLLDLA